MFVLTVQDVHDNNWGKKSFKFELGVLPCVRGALIFYRDDASMARVLRSSAADHRLSSCSQAARSTV